MRLDDVWLDQIGTCVPEPGAVASGPALRSATAAIAGRTSAPDLAVAAARRCLAASGLAPSDIGVLLYATVWHQGPDGWPAVAYLQDRLGLDDVFTTEVKSGCTGFFTCVDIADGLLARSGRRAALIVTADNFGTERVGRDCMGSGQAALGDAAVAVTVRRDAGFAQVLSSRSLTAAHLEILHRGSAPTFPPAATSGEPMDFGARLDEARGLLVRRGLWNRYLLEHRDNLVAVAEEAMSDAGVKRDDVSHLLLHSMPRNGAAALAHALDLPLDLVPWEQADRIGHIGAGDHPAALDHLRRSGRLERDDIVLLVGSSPGMTYKACVVHITDPRTEAE